MKTNLQLELDNAALRMKLAEIQGYLDVSATVSNGMNRGECAKMSKEIATTLANTEDK